MGRIVTPKYAVEIEVIPAADGPFRSTSVRITPAVWRVREYGRPNAIELGNYVAKFEASTREGGANAHLGITTVTRARIKRNVPGGEVVATYERERRADGSLGAVL